MLDYEFLTVSIAPEEISEFGGSAVGTVTRSNTDNNLPCWYAWSARIRRKRACLRKL